MDEELEIVKINRNVTCHTQNCENSEITIPVISLENSIVICGVCSQEITDIEEMGIYNG